MVHNCLNFHKIKKIFALDLTPSDKVVIETYVFEITNEAQDCLKHVY